MKKITFPSEKKIKDCLSSHVVSIIEQDDINLQKYIKSMTRYFRFYFYKTFLFKKIIGNIKSVSRVKKEYKQVWLTKQYPGSKDIDSNYYLTWKNKTYLVNGWAEKRVHLLIISSVISQCKISTYLEVGCGNGAMLMMLSVMHPEVTFVGIELTKEGVSSAKKMQKKNQLPIGMLEFLPCKAKNPQAFKNIKFIQGNAMKLPFNNSEFDFVSTSLALEQMNAIQESALNEISRVTNSYAGLLEPFPDCNQTKLKKIYTKSRNYFSIPINSLKRYGLLKKQTFFDFPQKLTRGVGYVLAEKK